MDRFVFEESADECFHQSAPEQGQERAIFGHKNLDKNWITGQDLSPLQKPTPKTKYYAQILIAPIANDPVAGSACLSSERH